MTLRRLALPALIAASLVVPGLPAQADPPRMHKRAAVARLDIGVVGVGRPRILVRGHHFKRVVRRSANLKLPAGRYRVRGLPVVRKGVRYVPRQRPYVIRTTTRRTTFVGFQYAPAVGSTKASRQVKLLGDPAPTGELGTMYQLINRARATGTQCGETPAPPVPPLAYDRHLAQSAQAHAEDMAATGSLTHTSSNGLSFADRVRASGFLGFPGGENIAFDIPTARETVNAWLGSPGHCMNLMDRDFAAVGLGMAERSDARYPQPVRYWVQDMGYPPLVPAD